MSLVGKHPAKLALAGGGIATDTLRALNSLRASFDVVVDCTDRRPARRPP